MKDTLIEMASYLLAVTGIIIMAWLFITYVKEERIKKEPISKNVVYKCIKGSLWQLSEDRTYFYPAPSPTKCLTNEEVK